MLWIFQGMRLATPGFIRLILRKLLQIPQKYMKLLVQLYFIYSLEGVHTYWYILVNARNKYQSVWLTACRSTEANNWVLYAPVNVNPRLPQAGDERGMAKSLGRLFLLLELLKRSRRAMQIPVLTVPAPESGALNDVGDWKLTWRLEVSKLAASIGHVVRLLKSR